MEFANRHEAGRRLGKKLRQRHDLGTNAVVLALPRGGAVIGGEVAKALGAPLDLVLVRKIGHPQNPEYAVGAVVADQEPVWSGAEPSDEAWKIVAAAEEQALNQQRREDYFGPGYHPPALTGRPVIIADDGIATGLTMQAAILVTRPQQPQSIIVAAPIASPDSVAKLQTIADDVVTLDKPRNFRGSVGAHYVDFEQVTDAEVRKIVADAQSS